MTIQASTSESADKQKHNRPIQYKISLTREQKCQPEKESSIRSTVWDAEGSSLAKRQIRMQFKRVAFIGKRKLRVRSRHGLNGVDTITDLTSTLSYIDST